MGLLDNLFIPAAIMANSHYPKVISLDNAFHVFYIAVTAGDP
jgi:hypothetical protein